DAGAGAVAAGDAREDRRSRGARRVLARRSDRVALAGAPFAPAVPAAARRGVGPAHLGRVERAGRDVGAGPARGGQGAGAAGAGAGGGAADALLAVAVDALVGRRAVGPVGLLAAGVPLARVGGQALIVVRAGGEALGAVAQERVAGLLIG